MASSRDSAIPRASTWSSGRDAPRRWKTSIDEIVSQAPKDWQVLQLTINNVRVLRTLMGLGVAFVQWRKNHWSTGAYIINRRGCRRTVFHL